MKNKILFTLCAMASSAVMQAGPILYTIGPDASTFTPNVFTKIDTGAQKVSPLFSLGNGTIGINGGVAYDAASSLFYTISNDSQGNSQLESLALASATFTGLLSPGAGFNGGLTFDSADGKLYAIDNDINGGSTLFSMPPTLAGSASSVLALGPGFTGGLAFDSLNGLFYAISNDVNGTSTLDRIDIAGNGSIKPLPVVLGSGFLGGLAFDAVSNLFYAIGNGSNGASTLFSIDLKSNQASALFGIGSGYVNAGLVIAPDGAGPGGGPGGPSVPEPSALSMAAIGCLLVAIGSLRLRKRSLFNSRPLLEQ